MTWEDPNQFALWDKLILGEHKFPGVARVEGSSSRDIEVLKSNENDGAALKDNGYNPATLSVTVRYMAADHVEIRKIAKDINPRTNGTDRGPQTIQHEQANFLGIDQVTVNEISSPKVSNGIGEFSFSVIEYFPERKKPKQKGPKGPVNTTPPDPGFGYYTGGLSGLDAINAGFEAPGGASASDNIFFPG